MLNLLGCNKDNFKQLLKIMSYKIIEAAIGINRFDEELIKINQNGYIIDKDEHPRKGILKSDLQKLKTVFLNNGTVTPGNSSGINDGAAALLLTTVEEAKKKINRSIGKNNFLGFSWC